ncbi:MAG: chorismate synthase [Candidatus Izemoplasmatales bacterium]
MNTFGLSVKMTLFGESHGDAMGITIDGLAPGILLNEELIQNALTKRRPKSIYSTSRSESDHYKIITGLYEGYTTGAPLTFIIENENKISSDYSSLKQRPRPSHADYPAQVKYNGFQDPRGGGIFSGRLTALMVIAGAIAKQVLNDSGIFVGSHILSLNDIFDSSFDLVTVSQNLIQKLETEDFPLIDHQKEEAMKERIASAKESLNSVGGRVESAIVGLPAGLGDPLFLSLESYLSSLLFSVPSIKGVEFGLGFDITKLTGKEANDEYQIIDGKVVTKSNNNGGILGGITTGMPVVVRVAVKPTPSIALPQQTVNLETMKEEMLEIKGRHDPAIVNRVVHVINSVLYFGILDFMTFSKNKDWMK